MSSISRWLCTNSSKALFVKIVHPGGHVELHDRPILAAELLGRNPKCCVAHPTVFQQPHAVVSPETTLLLGRKYYVVPLGTIRKLQLKHPPRSRSGDHAAAAAVDPRGIGGSSRSDRDRDRDSSSSACWLFRSNSRNGEREKSDVSGGGGGLGREKSRAACGSTSESSGDETSGMVRAESGGGGGGRRGGNVGPSSSPGRISLVSIDNWQPGLHSICEEY
ncbi:hypothetical protein C2S52_005365 [Perilla frutescens var. hirtella]|uniref:Uncharacterized protein n=1 Tax=Perilla frutescens var. hirtella TaxID=608512 RepID=A0AAD4IM60_PERFH|nr:hypothetical protein C2S53_017488 [Perilla frutescens var. hirtella]KAH6794888.1 hypothetical protein C2S52_005365 [Perilla frutescens var. hirtella]